MLLPSLAGWQFYGLAEGGPQRPLGVTSDEGGNIWVAGGFEGLYLLTPGATEFRRFTVADGLTPYLLQTQKAISVAGGPAGTVFVGYEGHTVGLDENDPAHMVKSGDADKVVLSGGGIEVTHFDISSPPGVSQWYPNGRDKIRSVFRIVYDHTSGDVWFGGTHGIAMYDGRANEVLEHHHADAEGCLANGSCYSMLTGDYYGIGLDGSRDLWFGGGARMRKLRSGTEPGALFWATQEPVIDIWPDAVDNGTSLPSERTEDMVQDLAVLADGSVWVGSIPNGLAHVAPGGTAFYGGPLADPSRRVTALELDPLNGSLWVGHLWNGLTRISSSGIAFYDSSVLGWGLANFVPDIQSDTFQGRRRILVAFESGAIGIYTGD